VEDGAGLLQHCEVVFLRCGDGAECDSKTLTSSSARLTQFPRREADRSARSRPPRPDAEVGRTRGRTPQSGPGQDWSCPAPVVDFGSMDRWTPAEIDAHVQYMRESGPFLAAEYWPIRRLSQGVLRCCGSRAAVV